MSYPPYRVETQRLVIRCWEPRDAPLVKDAIATSLDHLRPWMPWAHEEPRSLEEEVELLRRFRSRFDTGQDFIYGVFSEDERRVLGGAAFIAEWGTTPSRSATG